MMLQGLAEIVRCIVCLRTGAWPSRLKDAAEIDVVEEQLAAQRACRRGVRRAAIERVHEIEETARQRGWWGRPALMSDPALGLLMLALIVVVIMMGFPTAFTLMGLGMFFGFYAFYDPSQHWIDNRVFDLMVQRTYGAMTNDVLISIPLFVLMGYVMERGALVDKMFYSIQLSFRRVPASLAVATLIVCTFWGIASGLVGAVVVLMGVIAFNPMLRAGYDVQARLRRDHRRRHAGHPDPAVGHDHRLRRGRRAVGRQALRRGDVPGFFLAFLYLVYIIGWALINPKIAPPLPEERDQGSGAGLAANRFRPPTRPTCWSALRPRPGLARPGRWRSRRRGAPLAYWRLVTELRRRARAAASDGGHARAGLVVRRHPSAGRRPRTWLAELALRAARRAGGRAPLRRRPTEQGPPTAFYVGVRAASPPSRLRDARPLLPAAWTPSGSRS